jgi:hypothetical protein
VVSVPLNFSQNVNIVIRYFVAKWGRQEGFCWLSNLYGGNRQAWSGMSGTQNEINIPLDPLTAIGLGLVTPEELEYPPGILAAFNLLKGH